MDHTRASAHFTDRTVQSRFLHRDFNKSFQNTESVVAKVQAACTPCAGSTAMGSEKVNCGFSSSTDTELDSDGRSGGTSESGVESPFVRIVIMNESADRGPSVATSATGMRLRVEQPASAI